MSRKRRAITDTKSSHEKIFNLQANRICHLQRDTDYLQAWVGAGYVRSWEPLRQTLNQRPLVPMSPLTDFAESDNPTSARRHNQFGIINLAHEREKRRRLANQS